MNRNKPVTKLAVVDIETLDKTPSAVIFAIGCVVVDIDQPALSNHFYTVINPNQKGRTAGNGVSEWWLKQSIDSPSAFKELKAAYGSNKTLKAALYEFGSFLTDEFGDEQINMFGNGPEFDNVILADAFTWAGLKTPWPYWGNQSIRTSNLLMQIAGVKSEREFTGVKHHALDDAHHEAKLLIDALKLFKPAGKSTNPNIGLGIKAASESAEQAVKKLSDAFSKGINIENEQQKESADPYVDAVRSIYGALDSMGEEWRKPNQETRQSAVEKVREVAALINAFDMGELQDSHKQIESITEKLRSDGFDIKSPSQVDGGVKSLSVGGFIQGLTFENESLKEQAHCFDELQRLLKSVCEGSFERECASSLLDDCKHAIEELAEYKSKYMVLKSKHL